MKKNLLIVLMSIFAISAARADLIWYEGFNYTNGNLPVVATNGAGQTNIWFRLSGTGNDLILSNHVLQVAATGGVPVSRQDDCRRVLITPGGTSYTNSVQVLYASFTVICTNLMSGTGTWFAAFFGNSSSNGGYFGRVQALTNGTVLPNTWRLGVSDNASATATAVFPVDLATNVPYQVVLFLDPITLQAASLWVDPISSADPSVTGSDGIGKATVTPVDSFAFRQASGWGNGFVFVTNLSAATTFDEAATNVWATNAVAPIIAIQPKGVTNFVGDPISVSALAAGQGLANLNYQWMKDGQPVSNPNGNSGIFTLSSPQGSDTGDYNVIATTPYGLSATSVVAHVFVDTAIVPPSITSGPNSQTVYRGQSATFTVQVISPGTISYQWKSNGVDIPGQNGQSLTLLNVTTNFDANYSVGVTNSVTPNGVVSTNAVLTVINPPAVSIAYLRTLVDPNTYQATNVPATLPYQITGVVTTFTNITSGNTSSYYLQDGTAGINIFATFNAGNTLFRPAQGDVVTFVGVLSSFTSGLELFADTNNRTYTSFQIISNNAPLPASIPIPFTATNNLSNINYNLAESLVTITNVFFGTNAGKIVPTNANQNITVTNSSGQSFVVSFFNLDLNTAGQTLPSFASSVTGVLYGGSPSFSVAVTRWADINTNIVVTPIPIITQTTNGKIILTWSDPTFSLQSSTNVSGPYTNVTGATNPFTNSSGTGTLFFRLKH